MVFVFAGRGRCNPTSNLPLRYTTAQYFREERVAMTTDVRYFSRAWGQLTRDEGWYKPILILALVAAVPVVGTLIALGYALEWGRLTAWGIEATPWRRRVRMGACLASGWRGFVVALVWGLAWAFALLLVGVPVFGFLGLLGGGALSALLLFVANVAFGVWVAVAQLRAAIYTKISAGLMPARVYALTKEDLPGLGRVALIPLVGSLVVGIVGSVLSGALLMLVVGNVGLLLSSAGVHAASGFGLLKVFAGINVILVPWLLVWGYAALVVSTALALLTMLALGLWVRQFDVPLWGGPKDDLPVRRGLPGEVQAPQDPGVSPSPDDRGGSMAE